MPVRTVGGVSRRTEVGAVLGETAFGWRDGRSTAQGPVVFGDLAGALGETVSIERHVMGPVIPQQRLRAVISTKYAAVTPAYGSHGARRSASIKARAAASGAAAPERSVTVTGTRSAGSTTWRGPEPVWTSRIRCASVSRIMQRTAVAHSCGSTGPRTVRYSASANALLSGHRRRASVLPRCAAVSAYPGDAFIRPVARTRPRAPVLRPVRRSRSAHPRRASDPPVW